MPTGEVSIRVGLLVECCCLNHGLFGLRDSTDLHCVGVLREFDGRLPIANVWCPFRAYRWGAFILVLVIARYEAIWRCMGSRADWAVEPPAPKGELPYYVARLF